MQSEIAFSYALNKLFTTTLGASSKILVASKSVRSLTRKSVGETRVSKGWLQRRRTANGVGRYEVAVEERGVLRGNLIFCPRDGRESWTWADVGGKGPNHRAAAFVSVAAVVGPDRRRSTRWFRGSCGCVVMASGHGGGRHRFALAMIRGHGHGRRLVDHRIGGSHWGKRARKQDQQQKFGGPANHIFRIRRGEPRCASVHPPHAMVAFAT